MCGEPQPHDPWERDDGRGSQRARAFLVVATGRRGISVRGGDLSADRRRAWAREGENQLVLCALVPRMARRRRGGTVRDRDQTRQPMRGAAPALLRARSSDPEPGTLLGRIGKEAGRDGRIDAATAMAAGRPLARVSGSDLGSVGTTPRQERWDAGDDYAGASRKRIGMGPAD